MQQLSQYINDDRIEHCRAAEFRAEASTKFLPPPEKNHVIKTYKPHKARYV